jgi:CubicO group peptidase (beta-lactamase class C family)
MTQMINGTTDPRFTRLREVFAQNFDENLEFGAGVAVVLDGRPVAHLWGGHADAARNRPWTEDTLVNVWSVTKGVVAIAAAIAVEQGKLRYDQPLAHYWPAFAQNGKQDITLDLVMSHRAGLDGLSVPMDEAGLLARAPYVEALEAMAPLWEPGSACVYHALTYGHLVGETIGHADGRSIGRFVQKEIANTVGAAFFIGLDAALDHRAAEMVAGSGCNGWVDDVLKSPHPHSCQNPTPDASAANRRAWRAACVPGGNGHGSAAALAAIFGACVKSQSPLLSPSTLREATRLRYEGPDAVFNMDTAWSAGFRMKDVKSYGIRASSGTFGHGGWGGSLAFADPEARLGFAYVTNHMLGFDDGIDPRRARLVEAVYECL